MMKILTRSVSALVCAGLCASGMAPWRSAVAQDGQPVAAPSPAATAKPQVIPASERNRRSPVPATPESLAAGKALFSSQCTMCHGQRGDGRGDLARSMKLQVPDFTRPAQQKKRTDGELFYLLSHGHNEMPAETRLTEDQRWQIVLFLRTLAPAAPGPT